MLPHRLVMPGTQKQPDLTGRANEIKVTVYPNPVIDVLNLKWNSEYKGNARITIMDASGKMIKMIDVKKELTDYNNRILVSTLRSGIYYVGIKMQNGRSLITTFFKN